MKEAKLGAKGPEVWYYATVSGISVLLRNVLALASIEPKKLEEWRSAAHHAMLEVKVDERMSLGERIQAIQEADRSYYRLLLEAYRVLHNLVCKLGFPEIGNRRAYLGFTEDGALQMLSVEILKHLQRKAGEDLQV